MSSVIWKGNIKLIRVLYGGVKVSTGVWKPDKRAAVDSVSVKKGPLKRNDNNFRTNAIAA